jgi:hypothetical protein
MSAPAHAAQLEVVGQIVGLPLAGAEILTGLWLLFAGASLKYWNNNEHPSSPETLARCCGQPVVAV